MKSKVSSVKFSLPYIDPRKIGANESCAFADDNGYYQGGTNTLYLCLGKINTMLNPGALYGTISHEISHSIDPNTFSQDVFWKSKIALQVAKVFDSNASLDCDQWRKAKLEIFTLPQQFYSLPENIENLSQCLVDRSRLDKITHSSLEFASQRLAEESINLYAKSEHFTRLTVPEKYVDGRLKTNEIFLNPKLAASSGNKYLPEKYFSSGEFHISSIFVQDFKCRILEEKVSENEAFEKAIAETSRLRKIFSYNKSSVLMQNFYKLIPYNLSKGVGEDFADWLSHKGMQLALERQESTLVRQAFVLARHSTFCSPGGIERVAKAKTKIEKKFSRAAHPLGRKRRLRYFTPVIAELLNCERGPEVQNLDRGCDSTILKKQLIRK